MELKGKVQEEDLQHIQESNKAFSAMKMQLGELEIKKQEILASVSKLREDFMEFEKTLIAKYGQDSVINIATGEITYKKENG
jgi:hypothetical protein